MMPLLSDRLGLQSVMYSRHVYVRVCTITQKNIETTKYLLSKDLPAYFLAPVDSAHRKCMVL